MQMPAAACTITKLALQLKCICLMHCCRTYSLIHLSCIILVDHLAEHLSMCIKISQLSCGDKRSADAFSCMYDQQTCSAADLPEQNTGSIDLLFLVHASHIVLVDSLAGNG